MRLIIALVLILVIASPGAKTVVILKPEPVAFAPAQQQPVSIIPQPLHLEKHDKEGFALNDRTKIIIDSREKDLYPLAQLLAQEIKRSTGVLPQITQSVPKTAQSNIYLSRKGAADSLGEEGYSLTVNQNQVTLAARQLNGFFYGIQTLKQLLPPTPVKTPVSIPALTILDKPRYGWRGMHLDVARHFFPVEFIKKYIDYLAMHKLNTFHWHLTDDQGWRIEIKKYPKLTEKGAYRDGTLIGHALERPQQFDNKRYGGYYTQEEVREVVKYAQDRFITVVPEIEMPGHSLAALAAYPELSCTGGPHQVAQAWGIFEDVFCAGNEQTFTFLENVLTEVTTLFPSPIIHIGGDESPKTRWKACSKCQARIKSENLKDEHELQSYFVQRIEKFLNKKGKKIIGWDEILEGGLAPNALVMSWRGTAGGIAAAKQKHQVVMTPSSHVYFDHYQGSQELEPLAISGYTPLSKVYAYEPTPSQLTKEEASYILGAQANLWTEYIPTPEHAEYMLLPRLSALAEVLWTIPEKKDWSNFKQRMQQQYKRYEALGANYATSAFQAQQQVKIDARNKLATVTLNTDAAGTAIHYTLDGSVPILSSPAYVKPFVVKETAIIKAASFQGDKLIDDVTSTKISFHKGFGQPVQLIYPVNRYYPGEGGLTLVNGLTGSKNQSDGQWLGFISTDMEAIVELKVPSIIKKISSSYLQNSLGNAFLPSQVEYSVSDDGKNFKTIKTIATTTDPLRGGIFTQEIEASFSPIKARYVKVIARNIKVCPPGHRSAGSKAWLFADEIKIE